MRVAAFWIALAVSVLPERGAAQISSGGTFGFNVSDFRQLNVWLTLTTNASNSHTLQMLQSHLQAPNSTIVILVHFKAGVSSQSRSWRQCAPQRDLHTVCSIAMPLQDFYYVRYAMKRGNGNATVFTSGSELIDSTTAVVLKPPFIKNLTIVQRTVYVSFYFSSLSMLPPALAHLRTFEFEFACVTPRICDQTRLSVPYAGGKEQYVTFDALLPGVNYSLTMWSDFARSVHRGEWRSRVFFYTPQWTTLAPLTECCESSEESQLQLYLPLSLLVALPFLSLLVALVVSYKVHNDKIRTLHENFCSRLGRAEIAGGSCLPQSSDVGLGTAANV